MQLYQLGKEGVSLAVLEHALYFLEMTPPNFYFLLVILFSL